jgi:tRNA threonylcarbamoyladenosine biosynthesis protein TsaE
MSDILTQLLAGLTTKNAEATEAAGTALAGALPENHVLALHGDLGAGKTTFIRGLARAWEIQEPVTSPTFNLYTLYSGTRHLLHLDAYRLESNVDLDALMLDDFLKSPWCLAVEWPERIIEAIPENAWHLELSITKNDAHHIKLLPLKAD